MTTRRALSSAIAWAGLELGGRELARSRTRVLPWSATARLDLGNQSYWIKVSPPGSSATESRILTIARDRRITAVPTLVGSSEEFDALLIEHVPSGSDCPPLPDLLMMRSQVCTELDQDVQGLDLAPLSVAGCVEAIRSSPRGHRTWVDDQTRLNLDKAVDESSAGLAVLEAQLGRVRGVVHGDFHPGNVISSPCGPVIIDWADAAYGSPTWDVATMEVAKGPRPGARLDSTTAALAGLKEISDFLRTPQPIPDERYSVSIPALRHHISVRANALVGALRLLPAATSSLVG